MRFYLIPLVLSFSAFANDELLFEPVDESREREVPVKIYLPEGEAAAPVILFSHGLGGSREGGAYLGSHWAEAGYVSVHLQHPGSDVDTWRSAPPGERKEALFKGASPESFKSRAGDVPFIIDQLERWNDEDGHPLHGRLDLEHIGMSGHSFGAITTQAMMGQHYLGGPAFEEKRIDAFLPMSPSPPMGGSAEEAFAEISVPVLLMTGTEDKNPVNPQEGPEVRLEVYAALPKDDKFQLVFQDAQHSAFGGGSRSISRGRIAHHHPAIQKLSTQFWDAYLRGDEDAKKWLQSDEAKEGAGLVEEDVWEWK